MPDRSEASRAARPTPQVRDGYSRREFVAGLGGAAAALMLAACGGGSGGTMASADAKPVASRPGGLRRRPAGGSTRVVRHALGEVEIPADPRRLVTFEGTLNIIALGVVPIGARNITQDEANFPEMADVLTRIADLGTSELDIEEVLALEPDVIIGTSPNRDDIYGQLSKIAPTVLYRDDALDRKLRWDDELLFFADVLGREQQASDLLVAYEDRCAEFKARMGDRLRTTEVSVLRVSDDSMKIYTGGSFAGGVLVDAGLRRPPKQGLDAWETHKLTGGADEEGYDLSAERLREADGDVLFKSVRRPSPRDTKENQDEDRAAQERARELSDHPLWRKLRAVEAGAAYEVGGCWNGETILDAHKMLDDLFLHLLGDEPSS